MAISVETLKLSKHYGPIEAVRDLSFRVERGEVLGFLGPNGAGKSTTMKMLTGFVEPSSGTAKVCGHDVLKDPGAVKRSLGYLPESAPAYGEMTVDGFLKFVGRVRGFGGRDLGAKVDAIVERCALRSVRRQTFETLSKGYKRRVGLAQALIHDPPVLIMDEPTDGLDPNQKHEVRELISSMAEDKVIILSTHILEEVDAVCTRAIIIAGGRLVADGTPENLKERSSWRGAVTLALRSADAPDAAGELKRVAHVARVEELDARDGVREFRVFAEQGHSIAPEVARLAREKNWQVDEFTVDEGRLDEVFRTLTAGAAEPKREAHHA